MTNKDVSRQTVVILAVLVVVFSVLGTLTVMNEVAQMDQTQEDFGPEASGQVEISIAGDPGTSESQGQVGIEITDQNGG